MELKLLWGRAGDQQQQLFEQELLPWQASLRKRKLLLLVLLWGRQYAQQPQN